MGPFYCPADQKVYIDLSFYEDLKTRHQAPGDFAQAYVIAHEVGHHVQNLLGVSGQVHQWSMGPISFLPCQMNQPYPRQRLGLSREGSVGWQTLVNADLDASGQALAVGVSAAGA